LRDRLRAGEIFSFPFNYRADFRAETGYLIGNDEGYFVLVGLVVTYPWYSLETAIGTSEELADANDDDLDFEML